MMVRAHLLDWLRRYSKKDLDLKSRSLPEKILGATFLMDMVWMDELKQECKKKSEKTLLHIIKAIQKKKSYVEFP